MKYCQVQPGPGPMREKVSDMYVAKSLLHVLYNFVLCCCGCCSQPGVDMWRALAIVQQSLLCKLMNDRSYYGVLAV